MKDFYLTPRGDLAISNINANCNKLEISFITSFSNALCLNFFIEDVELNQLSQTSLSLNFNVEKLEYDKEIRIVSGEECMQQAIKIRLNTALGSLKGNLNIGSTLETLTHELIDNNNLINSLKTSIASAIYDLIPNPTIIINQQKSKYVNYSTGLNIVIIDNDKQYNISL